MAAQPRGSHNISTYAPFTFASNKSKESIPTSAVPPRELPHSNTVSLQCAAPMPGCKNNKWLMNTKMISHHYFLLFHQLASICRDTRPSQAQAFLRCNCVNGRSFLCSIYSPLQLSQQAVSRRIWSERNRHVKIH
jgi:hypothetical protein